MSSDDYIAIILNQGYYEGYWCNASKEYPTLASMRKEKLQFKTKDIVEAILKGQAFHTEYGIRFINLKPLDRKHRKQK